MLPVTEDETAVWSAALSRDERAFGVLFDRHRDRVFRHAARLVEYRAEAEDVTAAAFFELWRRRDAVRVVDGSVLPWLLVTATNLSRNASRGTRRYHAMLAGFPGARSVPIPPWSPVSAWIATRKPHASTAPSRSSRATTPRCSC